MFSIFIKVNSCFLLVFEGNKCECELHLEIMEGDGMNMDNVKVEMSEPMVADLAVN